MRVCVCVWVHPGKCAPVFLETIPDLRSVFDGKSRGSTLCNHMTFTEIRLNQERQQVGCQKTGGAFLAQLSTTRFLLRGCVGEGEVCQHVCFQHADDVNSKKNWTRRRRESVHSWLRHQLKWQYEVWFVGLVSCRQNSTKAVFGFLILSALQVLLIPTHFSHRRHHAEIDRECEIFFREGLQQVNLLSFELKVYFFFSFFFRTNWHLMNFANLQRKAFSVCLRIRLKLAFF